MIINQTERAIVEYVRERTKEELSKRIPCIDNIDYRRLTYLLIEYHGIKIVVSRPKSYTWEKNTNPAVTSDPNHAIYVQQLALQEQIAAQLKDMRADLKRTAEKLAKAHPDSDSIKRSFRLAFSN